ncbi:MAG TPA: alkaline phosphatase family protein [Thermoanaerobaculia bacterium]
MRRLVILVLVLVFTSTTFAAERPDLIVVVSIDQFPYYYLPRFAPYFAENGFNRFLKHGANFTEARYSYSITETGPGHAAIGTGNPPSRTGIVSNNWLDRFTRKTIYCVADPRVTPPFSPVNLDSDTLGDRAQEKYPGTKVVGIALKDRAAILMTGHKATEAYWFDAKIPGFTTSTYYSAANRTVINDYNATVPEYVNSHTVWEQTTFIPTADLQQITHDTQELRKYKTNPYELGVQFPHPIKSVNALTTSPYGNGLVISLAEHVLESEKPLLLYVGLSTSDYIGHAYGPDSLEAADNIVRTDRDLAAFFDFLDKHYGDRYTVALTSDHGVQSIPEVAKTLGRDAGRFNMANAKSAERQAIDPQGLILTFEEPGLYLNWNRVRELKLDPEAAKIAIRDAARKMTGVAGAWTSSELNVPNPQASGVELAIRNAFRADRSGDVLVALKSGWIWNYGPTGTTHGQPVEADMHVPVMFYGRGITPGTYTTTAAPTDIAKTLGALLAVDAGGSDSHVLSCLAP